MRFDRTALLCHARHNGAGHKLESTLETRSREKALETVDLHVIEADHLLSGTAPGMRVSGFNSRDGPARKTHGSQAPPETGARNIKALKSCTT
jgi:hypothetical protein